MQEVFEANKAIELKINSLKTLSLDKQKTKLEFEIQFVENPTFFKPNSKQYPTWELAKKAYQKELDKVNNEIFFDTMNTELTKFKSLKTKSQTYKQLITDLNNSIQSKNITDTQQYYQQLNAKYNQLLQAQQKRINGKAITLPDISEKDMKDLLDEFKKLTKDDADLRLRGTAEKVWNTLTDEEKRIATKYTQTYSYLNEPLRGLPYLGSMPVQDYKKDLPILTSVLSKFKIPHNMVVRRGTKDFPIKELGHNLANLQKGEIFTDKGFLSTAIEINSGFHYDYNLIIFVPKGARGFYAEPFSHYTDSNKYTYQSVIWNGKDKEYFGGEMEWIGQRGSQFKVVKKVGKTIYLKMIGQLK